MRGEDPVDPLLLGAWISTEGESPNMAPIQTAHFRVPLRWSHYAKWCADSRIALRVLMHRTPDSGQFRGLWGRGDVSQKPYQSTNLANNHSEILESHESLSDFGVRRFSLRGNPG